MVNMADLARSINDSLQRMKVHTDAVKHALGIKPNLSLARLHLEEANTALEDAALLVLKAYALGVSQPPDVVTSINTFQVTIVDLLQEVEACERVIAAGNARSTMRTTGRNASN